MTEVRIFIPGRPVAKERARRGRGGHWYTPEATRAYEAEVAWHCRAARARFGSSQVRVRIVHHCKELLPADLDNYTKSLFDGMEKGGVVDNDKQVAAYSVQVVVGSMWADGVELFVERLEPEECRFCAPDEKCAQHVGTVSS